MSAPRRLVNVPADATLAALVEQHEAHALALVDHRHGIGRWLDGDQVTGHALAELALSHTLSCRVLRFRWLTAAEALLAGATLAEVADACGLRPDYVRREVVEYLAGQVESHRLYGLGVTPAWAAKVRARLAGEQLDDEAGAGR